ncbi:MAG: alcohol dehydrogenase [Spirochaetales bacterium]|nr:alcohol dehydrogenase [Spirochaetales bacterium]
MKAIVCTKYGSPDVLQFKEVDKPIPRDDEALVKVYASSINAADVEMLRGKSGTRFSGPFRPLHKIPGSDLAGRIVAVGAGVTQFQPGDEVWGDLSYPNNYGTFAEYVCVPESALRKKPENMTFEEAAAIPSAAVVALQNLRGKRPVHPGQNVLINGAGGGVGTFAVQLAKSFGANVTGVDSLKKLGLIRSIGADHVIDYTREDFTAPLDAQNPRLYDLILDVVVGRSAFAYKRALRPNGICVMVGGSMIRVFSSAALGPLIMMRERKRIGIVMWRPNDKTDLDNLSGLFKAGKVVPVIDECYELQEVPEALRYLEDGNALGKLVIKVAHDT